MTICWVKCSKAGCEARYRYQLSDRGGANEHAKHAPVRSVMAKVILSNEGFAIAPQVLAEFIHVATDERRFERPLILREATKVARNGGPQTRWKRFIPIRAAMKQYFEWLELASAGQETSARYSSGRDLSLSRGGVDIDAESEGLCYFWWLSLFAWDGRGRSLVLFEILALGGICANLGNVNTSWYQDASLSLPGDIEVGAHSRCHF